MLTKSSEATHRTLLISSLLLTVVTIVATVLVDLQIAERFDQATGKTRALFGIVELTYSYKYFFSIGGLAAIITAYIAYRRGHRHFGVTMIFAAIVATSLVFLRLWTLMVDMTS